MDIQDQFAESAASGEDAFRLLIESASDFAILTLDLAGCVTSWSLGAQRIMGWREDEIVGQLGEAIFVPEDRAAGVPAREMQKSLEDGRADDERWHLHRDGTRFYANGAMTVLRDGNGQAVGFTKVMRDDTARKRAEEALRASEARYRTLFDSMNEGFAVIQVEFDAEQKPTDFVFLEANQSFEKQTGLTNVIGERASELTSLEPQWFETYGRVALTGEAIRFEDTAAALGRWFEVHAYPYGEPHNRQVAVFLNDITARRETITALRLSEERFRLATEAAAMYSWDVDLMTGKLIFAENAAEVLGFETLPQRTDEGRDFIHPEDLPILEAAIQKAIAEVGSFTTQFRLVDPQGNAVWAESHAVVQSDESGKPIRLFGITQNIAARKQAEADLKRANEELEARVQERTAKLNAVTAARGQLMRRLVGAQEEEQARISHDIHDHLGQQLALFMLGLNNLKAMALPPEAQEAVQEMIVAAHEFGQETHRIASSLRPTALDDLGLPAALENLVQKWSGRSRIQADFECLGFEERRLAWELESTIYRITQEALTNVLRHGEGTTRVSVVVQWIGPNVRALIEDNGPGFDTERAWSAPPEKRRLGLFGMRERAELVGGTLEVESHPGIGTTIVLQLPGEAAN